MNRTNTIALLSLWSLLIPVSAFGSHREKDDTQPSSIAQALVIFHHQQQLQKTTPTTFKPQDIAAGGALAAGSGFALYDVLSRGSELLTRSRLHEQSSSTAAPIIITVALLCAGLIKKIGDLAQEKEDQNRQNFAKVESLEQQVALQLQEQEKRISQIKKDCENRIQEAIQAQHAEVANKSLEQLRDIKQQSNNITADLTIGSTEKSDLQECSAEDLRNAILATRRYNAIIKHNVESLLQRWQGQLDNSSNQPQSRLIVSTAFDKLGQLFIRELNNPYSSDDK